MLKEQITAPIVICGLPRTGTTHLHNLISAEEDPRLARTQMGISFMDAAMPYFMRMHEMTVDHVHEEIQILAIDFSTMLMETTAIVPSWAAYYREHDQTSSYRYIELPTLTPR